MSDKKLVLELDRGECETILAALYDAWIEARKSLEGSHRRDVPAKMYCEELDRIRSKLLTAMGENEE